MKLFLTSQGLNDDTTPHLLKLLGRKPNGLNVAFIPTAADYKRKRGFWAGNESARLEELGFDVAEVDLRKENEKSLNKKLLGFDVVFVCGGNAFYLLKYVRKSGFDKAIRDFLERDGIYIGVSAGSYIAGINIEPATWKHQDRNRFGLKDLTGMGLVPFVVSAHLDDANQDIVEDAARKATYPVIALTDRQAILVDGSHWKIVGPGKKMTVNTRKPL